MKGFFGGRLFSRTLCDSICYTFRFGERTQAISCLGSCAAQICRYTKTKPCEGNQCSFWFIHILFGKIWSSTCLTNLWSCRPKVISPDVMSDVVYSEVTCHLTTKLFPPKRLWAVNIAKSFLLVVCETRFIFVIFPSINGPYVFDKHLSPFFLLFWIREILGPLDMNPVDRAGRVSEISPYL